MYNSSNKSNELTIDKIIEKFIPVVGAIFLTIWLGYLLYTTVWINMGAPLRLALGFFLSLTIIWGWFSFSDRLKYFADVTIWWWILLLYWTLIYWSRASDLAKATIPEYATLVTAFLFIIAIAYFASLRKSKVILVLWMIWSYITPFVIWQNDTWSQNISFNAYLTYFAAVNIAVFLLWKEISTRDIIPLNIAWLFFWTSTLFFLSYVLNKSNIETTSFFTWQLFSWILFAILVIFSMWSIIISAKNFEDSDEGYLAIWYLAPILWFMLNISRLTEVTDIAKWILYFAIWASCFYWWHFLKSANTRFQHVSLYAWWILSIILWFFAFIPELNLYSSLSIAYSSLVFWAIFIIEPSKWERFVSYMLLSLMGAILAMIKIFETDTWVQNYRTLFIIIALAPAMTWYFISLKGNDYSRMEIAKVYSFLAFAVAFMFIMIDIFKYFDAAFLIFYIPALLTLLVLRFSENQSHDVKSWLLRASLIFFAIWYIWVFLRLVWDLYPAPLDTSLKNFNWDWLLIKWIFATIILFMWLCISRRLQEEQDEPRPSFILVIFWYTSLLLTVNYMLYALMNDLWVEHSAWGPRAISTTVWWVILAITMLLVWIRKWSSHRSEKLLWLLLLAITVCKIMFYDLATMSNQFKTIVMMVVWWLLMLFSYWVHTKWWLKSDEEPAKKPKKSKLGPTSDSTNNTPTEFTINKKIKDIDISDVDHIIFEPNFSAPIKISTQNLKKIVTLIVDNMKKTEFEPNELSSVYETVISNYESSLSTKDYETLKSVIKNFVETWGKVKIVKK